MGYYTYYTLNVSKNKKNLLSYEGLDKDTEIQIAQALSKLIDDTDEIAIDYYHGPGDLITTIVSSDSMKWYSHESDLIQLSQQFPDFWFVLEGQGEEYDDIWRELFHNGMSQHVEAYIEYPPFDIENFDDKV